MRSAVRRQTPSDLPSAVTLIEGTQAALVCMRESPIQVHMQAMMPMAERINLFVSCTHIASLLCVNGKTQS